MTEEGYKEIHELADALSLHVEAISSEKRKTLHLAAVFANNFVNHLYGLAGKILEEEDIDFNILRPLIFETAHKVMNLSPDEAQTGPAKRGDENILNVHKNLLKKHPKLKDLYSMISESIQEKAPVLKKEKKESDSQSIMLTLW